MDAYDLSNDMKALWAATVDKSSGQLAKSKLPLEVCVWTEYGYRKVVGLSYNINGFIELELEDE